MAPTKAGLVRTYDSLSESVFQVYGLDLSLGMLRQAVADEVPDGSTLLLCNSCASRLPYIVGSFDLVFCVNALHHFRLPERFIMEARRVLKPDGRLAIVGLNPHDPSVNWYIYDYFEGVFEETLPLPIIVGRAAV